MSLTLIVAQSGVATPDESASTFGGRAAVARCSNSTLRGDYGFAIDGELLAGPNPGLLHAMSITHFDGDGNLSLVDFATINGIPRGSDWRAGTGVYELDSDCKGTMEIEFEDGSPTAHLRLAVVNGGREVLTIVEGNPISSRGVKVR